MLHKHPYANAICFQVCEKCPNVKYVREGYEVTVDIEKGMRDGEVSLLFLSFSLSIFI